MDPILKARHAQRLIDDSVLNEVMEEAHVELVGQMLYGDTEEEREAARAKHLGIDEIVNRLRYLASELEMGSEEEEE